MSQHTPAPWTIEPANDRRVYLVNHGSEAVGEIVYTDTRSRADARLIAAAPDLLTALVDLYLVAIAQLDQSATHDGLKNCEWLAQARAAITKATGEA